MGQSFGTYRFWGQQKAGRPTCALPICATWTFCTPPRSTCPAAPFPTSTSSDWQMLMMCRSASLHPLLRL
jgi:hypothetical protein